MALPTVLEKLQITEEKNILIQGLPSSLEKQFVKLNFAKNVTPLLKSRGIDLAIVFAINKTQLSNILKEVVPALTPNTKFWVAYPKPASKIASDLTRNDYNWECVCGYGFQSETEVELDGVWSAIHFNNAKELKPLKNKIRNVEVISD